MINIEHASRKFGRAFVSVFPPEKPKVSSSSSPPVLDKSRQADSEYYIDDDYGGDHHEESYAPRSIEDEQEEEEEEERSSRDSETSDVGIEQAGAFRNNQGQDFKKQPENPAVQAAAAGAVVGGVPIRAGDGLSYLGASDTSRTGQPMRMQRSRTYLLAKRTQSVVVSSIHAQVRSWVWVRKVSVVLCVVLGSILCIIGSSAFFGLRDEPLHDETTAVDMVTSFAIMSGFYMVIWFSWIQYPSNTPLRCCCEIVTPLVPTPRRLNPNHRGMQGASRRPYSPRAHARPFMSRTEASTTATETAYIVLD